ncbi:hypothetical protein R1flu_026152 [Riccia fluitans]|uniref:Uncharacterized protein n=1 Tax=Riccia fluitans TaxID=41844 RepID=A0ABD1XF52_9MARC
MASGSGRRKGKSPELPEEGELMPEVPPPPPKKGRPGPSQTQEEKTTHLVENVEMRHASFIWFVHTTFGL